MSGKAVTPAQRIVAELLRRTSVFGRHSLSVADARRYGTAGWSNVRAVYLEGPVGRVDAFRWGLVKDHARAWRAHAERRQRQAEDSR